MLTNYLDRAMNSLRTIGISFPATPAPVLAIIEKVAKYDNAKVTSIAHTLQQSSAFNATIRDQIQGMDISTRYADITKSFDSIRVDAQAMAEWMADGRLDMTERVRLAWMNTTRGTVPDRFNDIRKDYLDVAKSANDQLIRENVILDAYRDFRMALKSAEVDAKDVLNIATENLNALKHALQNANAAVEGYVGQDAAERARLELSRDEALRAVQDEDKCFQVIKDIADDLKTAYNTAELVFARLDQTHTVKDRLYQRAVTFFATNEVVFTGLAASFTSMSGLGEATNTLETMKDGMNKGLEALATTGGQQLEAGLRSGYGSTLKVSSVQALADAVVDFQASSLKLIEELRSESTMAARDIEAATEEGKRRFVALLNKGA